MNAWLYYLTNFADLGIAHLVFPGAVHSRFEHSLGVYWLAGEAVHKLKLHQVWYQFYHLNYWNYLKGICSLRFFIYQGLELGIDNFDTQTVKLAGNYLLFLVYPNILKNIDISLLNEFCYHSRVCILFSIYRALTWYRPWAFKSLVWTRISSQGSWRRYWMVSIYWICSRSF